MILSRTVKIYITENNYSYYENLGYDVNLWDYLLIPIEVLSKGSHHKILCKCDICGIEKEVIYKNYIKYEKETFGEYLCRKCKEPKRKKTLQENYGVDYPIQNKELYEKRLKSIEDKNKKS